MFVSSRLHLIAIPNSPHNLHTLEGRKKEELKKTINVIKEVCEKS